MITKMETTKTSGRFDGVTFERETTTYTWSDGHQSKARITDFRKGNRTARVVEDGSGKAELFMLKPAADESEYFDSPNDAMAMAIELVA